MKWLLNFFNHLLFRELINQGLASNMKIAKNLIQKNESIIDPVLEKVIKKSSNFFKSSTNIT